MGNERDWTDEQIKKAKEVYKAVPDEVTSRLQDQIQNTLGDRPLSRAELDELAKALILDLKGAATYEDRKDK